MIESYIDFVYLTKGGMPVEVKPIDYAEDSKGGYSVYYSNLKFLGKRSYSF
jgi:hypothetical protein